MGVKHRLSYGCDNEADLPRIRAQAQAGEIAYCIQEDTVWRKVGSSWEAYTGAQGPQGPPGADGLTTLRAVKTSDQTLIGTSYADVTGLGLSLLANKTYAFEFTVIADADATTTGIDIAVNGPASPTQIMYEQIYWTSATARTERAATAYDANTGATSSNGAAARPLRVKGIIRNGANAGTLIPRLKREAVGAGPNARAGSYGIAWQLD